MSNLLTVKKMGLPFRSFFLYALVLFFLESCKNSGIKQANRGEIAQAEIHGTPKEIVVDLQEIIKQKGSNGLVNVPIQYDQFFKKSKTYLGYELAPLLDSIIQANQVDTTKATVSFWCNDGYKPSMPIAKSFTTKKGYIVVKDKDATGNKNWINSLGSTFAPYYLVWQGVNPADHSFPWPYGLTKMSLMSSTDQYKAIYPFGNPEMIKGFTLFRDNCNKCHALNHIGGAMGPEFNVPKNITDYWSEDDIIRFALNPRSYRSSSKMPSMNGILTEDDLKSIVGYLRFVSKQKTTN